LQYFLTRAVDVETRKKKHGQVYHQQAPGHHAGLAAEPAAPVPLAKIVALDSVRPGLALDQHLWRDQLRIGLPVVGKVYRHVEPLQAAEHPPQGGGAPVPIGTNLISCLQLQVPCLDALFDEEQPAYRRKIPDGVNQGQDVAPDDERKKRHLPPDAAPAPLSPAEGGESPAWRAGPRTGRPAPSSR